MSEHNWHNMELTDTLAHLKVSMNGLTTSEAQQRLLEHGPNIIPEGQPAVVTIFQTPSFSWMKM